MARLTCPHCGNTTHFRTVDLTITACEFTIQDDGELLWSGDTDVLYDTAATYAIECSQCDERLPQQAVIDSKLCDIQLDKSAYEYTYGENTWIKPDC